MSSNRRRRQPTLDVLESRLVMSTGAPPNTIGVATGTVTAPHQVAHVSVTVAPKNINGRHSVYLGQSVAPTQGSGLAPVVVSAQGPTGQKLLVRRGAPFIRGRHNSETTFVRVGTPGPLTTNVTGRHGTTGPFQVRTTLLGDANVDGQVTFADLQTFAKSYLTTIHDALYSPASDANQNGRIGHVDGKFIVRNLKPLTPKMPLDVIMHLAPGDQANWKTSKNSGGATLKQDVTILGHTTPGSIVFFDSGLGDYTFTGPVLPTDTKGNFSIKVHNREGVNNYEVLVIDPYGQQTIRAFPVFWIAFANGTVEGNPIRPSKLPNATFRGSTRTGRVGTPGAASVG